MTLQTTVIVELIVVVSSAYLLIKLSFPLSSRRKASKQGNQDALARAETAWRDADRRYSKAISSKRDSFLGP